MNKLVTSLFLLLVTVFCRQAIATDFSVLYDQVSNSVVTVITNLTTTELAGNNMASSQQLIAGSGVISDKSGLIITASHVANLSDSVEIHMKNGDVYPAETISSFPFADIALLKIIDPPPDLPVAVMGDSDQMKTGEEIFIIGAPHGFSQTLTVGHFSGRPKDTGSFNIGNTEFLQTDAAINPGNSGGPMFNTRGEVVGIVSHIRTGSSGMGFAASSNMVNQLFVKYGTVWGGLEVVPMDDVLARGINAPYPDAVLVQEVAEGSLAARLGVRPGIIPSVINNRSVKLGGDVIVSIGGSEVGFYQDGIERTYQYLASRKQGEAIKMVVYRDGQQVTLSTPKP